MTQSNRFRFSLLIGLCIALAACQNATVSPTASPNPSPTALAPTSIPPIGVVSHQLLEGSNSGEWRVVGLVENQGQTALTQVQLHVSLLGAAGAVLAEETTDTLMSNLLPGEAAPFSVTFDALSTPAEAEIVPLSHVLADGQQADHRPELISELEKSFVTGNGELAMMGFITNPGNGYVALHSHGFLGRSSDGREQMAAVMQFGPGLLAPGESAPFLALAPENPGAVQWTQFHDGLTVAPPGIRSLELRGDPQLHLTAQGAPFVVGAVANTGDAAAVGSVMVSLFDGNRLIGLWEIETPRPLDTGEQLAFTAFGFPGVSLRFDPSDPSAIRVETRIEDIYADSVATPIDLQVDVSAFVSVGSAIFIRGTIHNPAELSVHAASVYAEVRSSTGELVTAGWSNAESLEPGGSKEFVLNLPIPVGMDATLTEYDLRAIGLTTEP